MMRYFWETFLDHCHPRALTTHAPPIFRAHVRHIQRHPARLWLLRRGGGGHRVWVHEVLGSVQREKNRRVGQAQRPQIYKHYTRVGLSDQEAAGPRGRGAEHPPVPRSRRA